MGSSPMIYKMGDERSTHSVIPSDDLSHVSLVAQSEVIQTNCSKNQNMLGYARWQVSLRPGGRREIIFLIDRWRHGGTSVVTGSYAAFI